MSDNTEIRTLDFNEAWNYFKTEVEMTDEAYRKARFGINILFDINDYLKGRITIKAKTGKAFIRGQAHRIEDFESELELRERKIKNWLLENLGEEDIAAPRGIMDEP